MGVCLGEQAIFEVFGGKVVHCGEIVHGKTSPVQHDGRGLYRDVPQDLQVTRYHSLAADEKTLPSQLEVTSRTRSGIVMGVRHREFTVEGVQYHPESVLSEHGLKLFENFMKLKSGKWADHPEYMAETSTASNAHPSQQQPSILQTIYAQRRSDVEQARQVPGQSLQDLESMLRMGLAPPVLNFYDRLRSGIGKTAVLAEVKRASPSKGDIDVNANASRQALQYAYSGASAISVLTEPHWFKGSIFDMRLVRTAIDHVPNRPAVLRKEFIFDMYQIAEARLNGADTVLLIVAMLDDKTLRDLMAYSRGLGMEPLVEINNAEELKRAIDVDASVIGVNNRNLNTFNVDMNTTSSMASVLHKHQVNLHKPVILAALSGIQTRADVERYEKDGVSAVLVGESLMRSDDPGRFIRQLAGTTSAPAPFVKFCGLTNSDDAVLATRAGAKFLGLIFADKSKRKVDVETASQIARSLGVTDSFFRMGDVNVTEQVSKCARPLLVGVFQNQSVRLINEVAATIPLDLIQLHGDEPSDIVKQLIRPVIRAIGVSESDTITSVEHKINQHAQNTSLILLDTKTHQTSGGSGMPFNWSIASNIAKSHSMILAGGLTVDNVKQA